MTKELYRKEINNVAKEVLKEPFPSDNMHGAKKNYIAVQHREHPEHGVTLEQLAKALNAVSRGSSATIVFFDTDSFAMYKKVASLMEEPSIVYKAANVWKVVAVVSQAEAVLST
eukprot:8396155-Ditylum_brightwellii.AAC.1